MVPSRSGTCVSASSVVRLGPTLPVRTSHHAHGRTGPAEMATPQRPGGAERTRGAPRPLVAGHAGWSSTPGEGSRPGLRPHLATRKVCKPRKGGGGAGFLPCCVREITEAGAGKHGRERERERGGQALAGAAGPAPPRRAPGQRTTSRGRFTPCLFP